MLTNAHVCVAQDVTPSTYEIRSMMTLTALCIGVQATVYHTRHVCVSNLKDTILPTVEQVPHNPYRQAATWR